MTMTTKKQDKKGPAPKPEVKKAPPSEAKDKKSDSIGFLRAAEKAHLAVMDIPLDFFADLGMFPERVRSTKDMSRRFISGMYNNLDSASTKIGNVFGAPGRLVGGLVDKLQQGSATPNAVVRPKAKSAKEKSVAKKTQPKAKAAAPKAKAKAAALKAKAKAGKPKSKAKSAAASGAKAAKKAAVKVNLPNPSGIH
jgi:hypothetical protein